MERDIRVDLANIFARAQHLIKKETELKLEIIYILGELKENNAGPNLGFFEKSYIQALGLTPDQYYKRIAAYQALKVEPAFEEMINSGQVHLTHLAMIAPKITEANRSMIMEFVPGKSKRELEAFLSTLTPDGKISPTLKTVELRFRMTEDQFATLERARDVLSARGNVVSDVDVVVRGLEDLLNKRDPLRKAKRAERRKLERKMRGGALMDCSAPAQTVGDSGGGSASPPRDDKDLELREREAFGGQEVKGPSFRNKRLARVRRLSVALSNIESRQRVANSAKHLVWQKYEGQCGYHDAKGNRCPEFRMLEIDHILPRCRGGDNSLDNLRLLCRSHNQQAARELLGSENVGPKKRNYSWRRGVSEY